MAKKIPPPSMKSQPFVAERYEWRYKPFSINTCELCHNDKVIATMKTWGVFPPRKFTGRIKDNRFEIRFIRPERQDHLLTKHEIERYSVRMEGKKGEWKEGKTNREWGRLEYYLNATLSGQHNMWTGWDGPSFINIPAKIIVNGIGEYSIGERIESPSVREYSIIDKRDEHAFRVLARTTRPPEGEICGKFERFEARDGEPDSLMLAVISHAFAEIVWQTIDAHA